MNCKIEGCSRALHSTLHQLCYSHYHRYLRYGNPEGGYYYQGEQEKFFNETILTNEDKDNCLIWPFGKSKGWAYMSSKGHVGRVICEEIYGPAPGQEYEAAHSCGNGNLGCVNKHHLRWATQSENYNDRRIHKARS